MGAPVLLALLLLGPQKPLPKSGETPIAIATKISNEYAAAMRRLDVSWFEKHSDPTLMLESVNEGTQDRDAVIVRLKTVWSRVKKVEGATVKVVSAKRTSAGLLVVTDTQMAMRLEFHHDPNAKIEMITREESLWTKKGGNWMAMSIKQLKDGSKLNGRPLLMGFG